MLLRIYVCFFLLALAPSPTKAQTQSYEVQFCDGCALINDVSYCAGTNITIQTEACEIQAGRIAGTQFNSYLATYNRNDPNQYALLFFNDTSCIQKDVIFLVECDLHSCCPIVMVIGDRSFGAFLVGPNNPPPHGDGDSGGDDFPTWAIVLTVAGGTALCLAIVVGLGVAVWFIRKNNSYQSF